MKTRKRWPWLTLHDLSILVPLSLRLVHDSWTSIEDLPTTGINREDIPIVPGRAEDFGK